MTSPGQYRPKKEVLRAFYTANTSCDTPVHVAVRQFVGNGYHHIDLDLTVRHIESLLMFVGIADWLIQPTEGEASDVNTW